MDTPYADEKPVGGHATHSRKSFSNVRNRFCVITYEYFCILLAGIVPEIRRLLGPHRTRRDYLMDTHLGESQQPRLK